jgi:hypothetical protein
MPSDITAFTDDELARTEIGDRVLTVTPTRLRWWREVLLVAAFYGLYSTVRNIFGSQSVSPAKAFAHAKDIIKLERAVGLYHEATIQHWFLHLHWFLWFWNVFYGTFHFIVTIVVLVFLFRRYPLRYRQFRNVLAFTTAFALIGFSMFPLMPLLGDCGAFGGCTNTHFVDTLKEFGGLWSFSSGTMQSISNQYAAMPSLHFAWSSWCWLAMRPVAPRRWQRVALAVYPWLTLFAIIVTGNHYWVDAAGGAALLGAGYLLGTWLFRVAERHRPLATACTNS